MSSFRFVVIGADRHTPLPRTALVAIRRLTLRMHRGVQLINQKKKDKSKKYTNSGIIKFDRSVATTACTRALSPRGADSKIVLVDV